MRVVTDATRCLDFSSECTKMSLAGGVCPGPAGGVHSAPQTPYLDSSGPTSKGKKGGVRPILYPDLGTEATELKHYQYPYKKSIVRALYQLPTKTNRLDKDNYLFLECYIAAYNI